MTQVNAQKDISIIKILVANLLNEIYNIYIYLKVKKYKEATLVTIENNKELKKKSKNRNISCKKNFKNQYIFCKREKHAEKKY